MTRFASMIREAPLGAPTYFELMSQHLPVSDDARAGLLPDRSADHESAEPTAGTQRPDARSLCDYVLEGAAHGFKHHFSTTFTGFHCKPNYKSAVVDAERITAALAKRVATGKTLGPIPWDGEQLAGMDTLCVNPMGSVPYKHEPLRSRPIDDPAVNAALYAPPFCMPTFQLVREFSTPGCWYGLQDVEAAFTCLPIHYDMWKFFAVAWADVTVTHPSAAALRAQAQHFLYVHTHGLFGSCDMPYIFTMYMLFVTMVSTALGMALAPPYLDDIPHVFERRSEVTWALERYSALLAALGSPEKASKRQEAFQRGDILGREFNSRSFTVGVPGDKMIRFLSRLRRMFGPGPRSGRIPCAEVGSLLGEAAFISTVLPTVFANLMAPIFDMARSSPAYQQYCRKGSRRDRFTVRCTLEATRAGRSLIQVFPYINRTVSINTALSHPWSLPVYSDASGGDSAGWGFASRHAFQAGSFSCSQRKACIAYLELYAVWEAVLAHEQIWAGHRVPFYIDNTVVVSWVTYGRVRSADTHSGLRARADALLLDIHARAMFYGFELDPRYITSAENEVADALSRHDYVRFGIAFSSPGWGRAVNAATGSLSDRDSPATPRPMSIDSHVFQPQRRPTARPVPARSHTCALSMAHSVSPPTQGGRASRLPPANGGLRPQPAPTHR
jgi:hypothetical protein